MSVDPRLSLTTSPLPPINTTSATPSRAFGHRRNRSAPHSYETAKPIVPIVRTDQNRERLDRFPDYVRLFGRGSLMGFEKNRISISIDIESVAVLGELEKGNYYCTLALSTTENQSEIATNSSTPEWVGPFSFQLPHPNSLLRLLIFNTSAPNSQYPVALCNLFTLELLRGQLISFHDPSASSSDQTVQEIKAPLLPTIKREDPSNTSRGRLPVSQSNIRLRFTSRIIEVEPSDDDIVSELRSSPIADDSPVETNQIVSHISILEARKLVNKDNQDTCNPYFILRIGEEVHRSSCVLSSDSPKWGSEYVSSVTVTKRMISNLPKRISIGEDMFDIKEGPEQIICVEFYSQRKGRRDDLLGMVTISPSDVLQRVSINDIGASIDHDDLGNIRVSYDGWFKIEKKKKSVISGEAHLSIVFLFPDVARQHERRLSLDAPVSTPGLRTSTHSLGRIFMRWSDTGTCHSSLGGVQLETFWRALSCLVNPITEKDTFFSKPKISYTNEDLVSLLQGAFQVTNEYTASIFDEACKNITRRELIRHLKLQYNNLSRRPGFLTRDFKNPEYFSKWLAYEQKRLSQILQHLILHPDFKGDLIIKVIEARNIPHNTSTKVKITLGSNPRVKTGASKKSTNPVYGDAFQLSVQSPHDAIDVVLWDKDILTKHKCLGRVKLAVADFYLLDPVDDWYPFIHESDDGEIHASGEVRLQIMLREVSSAKSENEATPRKGHRRKPSLKGDGIPNLEDIFALKAKEIDVDPEEIWPSTFKVPYTILDSNSSDPIDLNGVLACYAVLLRTLLHFETQLPRKKGLIYKQQKIVELTPASRWILHEFAQRYGVGKFFQRMILVQVVAEFLVCAPVDHQYLTRIISDFADLMDANQSSVTVSESHMVARTVSLLYEHAESRLESYKAHFVNNLPSGALNTWVSILHKITGTNSRGLSKSLTALVESGIEKSYALLVDNKSVPTIMNMVVACDVVMSEVQNDCDLYYRSFPKDFDLPQVTAAHYIALFRKAISKTIGNLALSNVEESEKLLLLFARFQKLVSFAERVLRQPLDKIAEELFSGVGGHVSGQLKKMLDTWVTKSLATDVGVVLDTVLKVSSSVIDLFAVLLQMNEDVLKERKMDSFIGGVMIPCVCGSVQFYVMQLAEQVPINRSTKRDESKQRSIMSNIARILHVEVGARGADRSPKSPRDAESMDPTVIAQKSARIFNNIAHAETKFGELVMLWERTMEDGSRSQEESLVRSSILMTRMFLRRQLEGLLQANSMTVIDSLEDSLSGFLVSLFQPTKDTTNSPDAETAKKGLDSKMAEPYDELRSYIRGCKIYLSVNCYAALLRAIWTNCTLLISRLVATPVVNLIYDESSTQAEVYSQILVETLHAMEDIVIRAMGNSGPTDTWVASQAAPIRRTLEQFASSTSILIAMIKAKESNETDRMPDQQRTQPNVNVSQVEQSLQLLRSRTKDKDARKFMSEYQKPKGAFSPNEKLSIDPTKQDNQVLIAAKCTMEKKGEKLTGSLFSCAVRLVFHSGDGAVFSLRYSEISSIRKGSSSFASSITLNLVDGTEQVVSVDTASEVYTKIIKAAELYGRYF